MKLLDLHPRWIGSGGEGVSNADGTPAPARQGVGIMFDCPCGCQEDCFIPFENSLDGGAPCGDVNHLWHRTGEDFETLTLSPSIRRVGGCAWHGFITNGEVKGA